MIVKAKVSVSDQSGSTIIYWLEQVGFNSFAYRLAHLPISRGFLLCALTGLFVFL